MTDIGKRLLSLREKRNLKQHEVASQSGISKVNLSRYENGKRTPSKDALEKLAAFYEVTPAYLMFGEENDQTDFLKDISEEEAKLLKEYLQKIRKEPK